jgi:multiple sugar transport system substrate-binding protein
MSAWFGKTGMIWIALSVVFSLTTGCGVDLTSWLQSKTATPTAPAVSQTATPLPTDQVAKATATPSGPQTLEIWVPPQFDPTSGSSAAEKLRTRLAAFEAQNPDLKVQVRVKAASGPGGLMESLSAASAAAPAVLPALVALSRSDLETAALKGLVFSLDGLTRIVDDTDWYAYARQLALIQGSAFGLPFAGDAMLLLYRPAKLPTPPPDWQTLIKSKLPTAFAAADGQALTTLQLYLSAGGEVNDNQGRPTLQADTLAQVLKLIDEGVKAGIFPNWLSQYQTDGQAWQAYREQRTDLLVTWSSNYLADLPADTAAAPLPSLGDKPVTLATGWIWALSDPLPERRAASIRLAEFLVDSEFLAQWSANAGYLPTRPSALTAWSNAGLRSLFSPIALSAQVRPSNDLLLGLGPILEDATLQIIKQQGDPVQIAQAAAERLAVSPSK